MVAKPFHGRSMRELPRLLRQIGYTPSKQECSAVVIAFASGDYEGVSDPVCSV